MREIILQPGTSIEIDGVRVSAAGSRAVKDDLVGVIYDPSTGEMTFPDPEETDGPQSPQATTSAGSV